MKFIKLAGQWMIMHPILSLLFLCLLTLVVLNILAYRHAYAMLHFTPEDSSTASPENLSLADKIKTLTNGVNLPRAENTEQPDKYDLQFTTHEFSTADGIKLEGWYIPNEEAKGLVHVYHGYRASKSSMLSAVKAFHSLGFSVFAIDFRGSGGSDLDYTTIGYFEALDVVAAVEFTASLSDNQPLILYGQSMGGAAIMRALAVHDPKVDGVILEAVFNTMLETVKNRFGSMGIPTLPAAHLLTFWGGWQMGFSALDHNPVDYAHNVTCPVLLMNGADDPRATTKDAKEVFEALVGRKAYVEFQDTAHTLCCESDINKWNDVVGSFATSL